MPKTFGPYELVAELASGGMATVYVARDLRVPGAERLVVLKRVHPHLLRLPKFREMFHDEARLASQVRHANVVRLLDVVGDDEGELLLVLEYVESVSLAALLAAAEKRGERLPPAISVRIVVDMLAGLHAAHEAKDARGRSLDIVHRDVSPQNVLVGVDGTSHIIDFGVAKAATRLAETTSGGLKGKLGYMSPEQAKGGTIDRRSDLFAAAIVLHEALTGARLFPADDGDGSHVLLKILLDPIDPPSAKAKDVPAALDDVVLRALERVRDERHDDAAALATEIAAALPPASHDAVARAVERLAGDTVAKRRADLARVLEGLEEPRLELPARAEVPRLESSTSDRVDAGAAPQGDAASTRRAARGRAIALAAAAAFAALGIAVAARSTARRAPVMPPPVVEAPASSEVVAASAEPAAPSAPLPAVSTPMPRSPIRIRGGPPRVGAPAPHVASSAPPRTDLHDENPY